MTEPRKTPQKTARSGQKRPRKPPPQRLVQKMQKVVPPVREQLAEQPEAPAEPAVPAGPAPARLTAAAVASGLEGLGVAAWAVTMLSTGSRNGILGGLLVLLLAAIPLAAAYGLRRVRRWSRGPALIIHLLGLPVAWSMLHSDTGGIVASGAALTAVSLAGLVLLVHPATTDALGIRRTA